MEVKYLRNLSSTVIGLDTRENNFKYALINFKLSGEKIVVYNIKTTGILIFLILSIEV